MSWVDWKRLALSLQVSQETAPPASPDDSEARQSRHRMDTLIYLSFLSTLETVCLAVTWSLRTDILSLVNAVPLNPQQEAHRSPL